MRNTAPNNSVTSTGDSVIQLKTDAILNGQFDLQFCVNVNTTQQLHIQTVELTASNIHTSYITASGVTRKSGAPGQISKSSPPLRRGVVVSGVRRMNEVNARRARLVLGWVTVFGQVFHFGM